MTTVDTAHNKKLPPPGTLGSLLQRFQLESRDLDAGVCELLQYKLKLDAEIRTLKGAGHPYTPERFARLSKKFGIDPATAHPNIERVFKATIDSERYLAALRPKKLNPPATEPKKEEKPLCFLTNTK